jgi:hypothetical protein
MAIAFAIPVAAAINIVLLKRTGGRGDLVPAVLIGALICCAVSLPLAGRLTASGADLAILAALGVFQLGLPCILMVRAAQHLAPHEIALLGLLEVVLGPLWAWIWAGETPGAGTLQGGMLVLGANWLVNGAVGVAQTMGVSEALIGLTLVAAGTSLPELATSVVAAVKKESDIAVGNVIGSNIFNLLCIGGLAPMIKPFSFPAVVSTDFYVMLGLTFILVPISLTGRRFGRLEGLFFLACYGAYLFFMWPQAQPG